MINQQILKERGRIKDIIKRKIEAKVEWRRQHIKHERGFISLFEKLEDDIIFLIENPNYKRKKAPLENPPKKETQS